MKIVRSALVRLRHTGKIEVTKTDRDSVLVSTIDNSPLIQVLEEVFGKFHMLDNDEIVFIENERVLARAINATIIHDYEMWEFWVVNEGQIDMPKESESKKGEIPNIFQPDQQLKCPLTGDVQTYAEWRKEFAMDAIAQEDGLSFEEWIGGELVAVEQQACIKPTVIQTTYNPVNIIVERKGDEKEFSQPLLATGTLIH